MDNILLPKKYKANVYIEKVVQKKFRMKRKKLVKLTPKCQFRQQKYVLQTNTGGPRY